MDELECTSGSKSKLDAIVEEDIPKGVSSSYKANINERLVCKRRIELLHLFGKYIVPRQRGKRQVFAFCGLGLLKNSASGVHLRVEKTVGQFSAMYLCCLHGLKVSTVVK